MTRPYGPCAIVLAVLAVLGWLAVGVGGAVAQPSSEVVVTGLRGPVTPVVAERLVDAIDAAELSGAEAVLVEMDTPGGLDTSMRTIVQAFLNAEVPVVVYVEPSGARAASAGALISFSAHVLGMAPGTTIGAATPVDLQGGEVLDKVVNDAASYAEAIATERDRDVEFAVEAVREGRSVAASEALEIGVADMLADDRADLLQKADGQTVELADGRSVTLATADAAIVDREPSLIQRFLERVVDPNLAFLFISIGTLAIIYELAQPGVGAGGIVGAILLLLAFYALSVLPVNLVGVLLLVLGVGLLIGEIFAPGLGVLAAGGTVSLLLAGLFLFQRPTGIGVDLAVLIPTVCVAGAGALGLAVLAGRLRGKPALIGQEALVGQLAEVRTASGHTGQVLLNGALWSARSADDPLKRGSIVRVIDQDGLQLTVSQREQE